MSVLGWAWRNFKGFWVNLWVFLTDRLHLRDILLPAFYDSLVWFTNQVPNAFGFGRRDEMLEASVVLAIATFFTGIVTGGLAWVIIALWIVTFMVGILRFLPFVESRWPLPPVEVGPDG